MNKSSRSYRDVNQSEADPRVLVDALTSEQLI